MFTIGKNRCSRSQEYAVEPKPSNKSSKQEKSEQNKDIEPKKTENEEKEQVNFNPSPFNMKPW